MNLVLPLLLLLRGGEGPLSIAELRRLSKSRRRWVPVLIALPMLISVGLDASRRGARMMEFAPYYQGTYAASMLESLCVWGLLLYAASRRYGPRRWVFKIAFALALTLSFGGQRYFFEQYNAYLNVDVSLFASNFKDSIVNQLGADLPNYLGAIARPSCLALGLLYLGPRLLRPGAYAAGVAQALAPVMLLASLFLPTQNRHVQASVPDMLYTEAIGGLIRTQLGWTEQSDQMRPRLRESASLPLRVADSEDPKRNVLFLILESVRADATCMAYDPDCEKTGHSNVLLPDRVPLRQMRSLASCTAISLSVMWGGIAPTESRDVLHSVPLIFDFAKAAGWDTAFWTSQNMMFGNARLWVRNLGVSQFVSATDLEATSDLDMGAPEHLLATHVNQHIGELKEPFLAVVQLSNVHYPYYVEAEGPQPFQPATTSKAPGDNAHFFNNYLNSVHQEDRHVASIIRHLRSTERGRRTVIIYTSDHGEAVREHGQMGHTFSVLDEEIHVPAWVDAPPGTLSETEREHLESKSDSFSYHPDLTATVLDLMGVWELDAISEHRERMVGHSLLDAGDNEAAMPLTNCAGVWSCAFENWGYMQRNMKLEARAWDHDWHCYDIAADPKEKTNLGTQACAPLYDLAMKSFGKLPGATSVQERNTRRKKLHKRGRRRDKSRGGG